jgi:pimeloyl-ACP methyl ester carboxylesterase
MTEVDAAIARKDESIEPFASGTVDLDTGIHVYYERYGSGTPIVLIAGTSCDHTFWSFQVPKYASAHEVILLDNRGAGRSSVVADVSSYSPAIMAGDVVALLDVLGVDAAHIAGHSLGSCIAQELALCHPDRVLSAQLHATWARSDQWLKQAFIGTTRYPLAQGDAQFTFKTAMMWMLSPQYLETRQPQRVADMVTRSFVKNPHLQANDGMLGHLWADEVHDTADRLSAVRVPVLVTAGEADYLIPARYGRAVANLIPDARIHVFEGDRSSHALPWEMEEEFTEVTSTFLEGLT